MNRKQISKEKKSKNKLLVCLLRQDKIEDERN